MLRLHWTGVALLAALGCSPVKDNSNVPDASIDATDMRPPMITSSIPGDMGTKVPIVQPISVYFDERLDPASVSATTVKLGYIAPMTPFAPVTVTLTPSTGPGTATGVQPVKGTVSYDADARKVSFVPAAPLPYGAKFVLSIDVKDTAGLAFSAKLSFITYVNATIKQYIFGATNNAPSSWMGFPTDMNGRPGKRVGSSSPGTDGVWFTMDDPRNQHFVYTFNADGTLVDERQMGSGGDSQFDTADDTVVHCVTYRYDAGKVLTERTYPNAIGPDSMWCTPDDVPAFNYIFTYMDSSLTGYLFNTGPGPDTIWRTADDRCSQYFEHEYNAQGLRTREIQKTCDTDQLPHTIDDVIVQYYQYEYDADGMVSRATIRNSSGADTIWFNDDDGFSGGTFFPGVTRYQRDADGQVTEVLVSVNAGPDAMFGTADDGGTRTVNEYTDKLVTTTTVYTGVGTDNMWGTDDDVIGSYSKIAYDGLGNRIDLKTYNSGPDAVWKNADDRVTAEHDFDSTR